MQISDLIPKIQASKTIQVKEKALALMAPDLETIRTFAHIDPDEREVLTSPQRPIVLLRKRANHAIAAAVSPRNAWFGVMLPYTPLHYLLLAHDFTALVMTSGNLSADPLQPFPEPEQPDDCDQR